MTFERKLQIRLCLNAVPILSGNRLGLEACYRVVEKCIQDTNPTKDFEFNCEHHCVPELYACCNLRIYSSVDTHLVACIHFKHYVHKLTETEIVEALL